MRAVLLGVLGLNGAQVAASFCAVGLAVYVLYRYVSGDPL